MEVRHDKEMETDVNTRPKRIPWRRYKKCILMVLSKSITGCNKVKDT